MNKKLFQIVYLRGLRNYFLPIDFYCHVLGVNQYETAIRSVVDIIEDYDSDGLMPVLGFGARLPPDGKVSHEFFVNGHPTNPYCEGTSGVLAAYKACVSRIQLFGPTNFSPSINHVSSIAKNFLDGTHYFILLIITDGIITDMEETKEAIVAAAKYPMSIIIIGVGEADFGAMEELDGDDIRVTTQTGQVASRDIVQFVPIRNFFEIQGKWRTKNQTHFTQSNLAKEVLAEIPGQLTEYMRSRNIKPKNMKNDYSITSSFNKTINNARFEHKNEREEVCYSDDD